MIASALSFATTKTGRWVVGGAIFAVIVWATIMNHNRTLLKMERLRAERQARKTQSSIEEKNDEKLEKTRITRADPPVAVPSSGLSDDQRRRLIRD